jgi:hypothetical protein
MNDGSPQVHCPECGGPQTVELAPDRTFEPHRDSCGLVSTESTTAPLASGTGLESSCRTSIGGATTRQSVGLSPIPRYRDMYPTWECRFGAPVPDEAERLRAESATSVRNMFV